MNFNWYSLLNHTFFDEIVRLIETRHLIIDCWVTYFSNLLYICPLTFLLTDTNHLLSIWTNSDDLQAATQGWYTLASVRKWLPVPKLLYSGVWGFMISTKRCNVEPPTFYRITFRYVSSYLCSQIKYICNLGFLWELDIRTYMLKNVKKCLFTVHIQHVRCHEILWIGSRYLYLLYLHK